MSTHSRMPSHAAEDNKQSLDSTPSAQTDLTYKDSKDGAEVAKCDAVSVSTNTDTRQDAVESNPKSPSMDILHEEVFVKYRLYRQRHVGLAGIVVLAIVTGMTPPWFGPISTNTAEQFNISLNEVNWLGNIMSCIYLPVSLLIPIYCARYGVRRCSEFGVGMLLISGWVRYAGTLNSLSSSGAYTLLLFGQLFAAFSQPVFQVIGPKYSEKWYGLRERTTATMVMAIANPVGAALGQLISPLCGSPKNSVLILAIISTAACPAVFLIGSSPPTPPTFAASHPPLSLVGLLRAFVGMKCPSEAYMSVRDRIDMAINLYMFGVLVGATNTFSILSAQFLEPAGYSSTICGLMGATLLLAGLVSSAITAPLFDRVFTHHFGITLKILIPILAGCWLSLIWAVVPNNTGGLFAIMAIIGCCSLMLLPVGLELGCEFTRNAEGSAAFLWCSGNLFSITFILAEGALRAGADASPPYNMQKAFIFNGVFVMAVAVVVFFMRAKQSRRELDEQMNEEALVHSNSNS